MKPTLLVLTGPTGVGKTELSLRLAEHLGSPILSADSRQIYREIPVGTAAPTAEEQARVKHYFVGTRSVTEDYNAGLYERDALALLSSLFADHEVLLMTGGSMLYLDAVCRGLDDIPSVPEAVRQQVRQLYAEQGLEALQQQVSLLDPAYWAEVDRFNPQRLMHCLELCLSTGQPYSSLRRGQVHPRPFEVVKVCLMRERAELYDRINRRVDQMVADGLEQEAERMYPLRTCNALQTVGYREWFDYMDAKTTRQQALDMIRQNSRHYAKRQLTWFRADSAMHYLEATNSYETQLHFLDTLLLRARGL